MMMGLGVTQVGIAWFALRRGATWGFWALVLSNFLYIPYAIAITSTFASFGVMITFMELFFYVIFPLPLVLALVLGWMGLQRMERGGVLV
ncbi:MAG TPA: hypothetical protein VGK54_11390 [Chloroflexota bacterium]|jgi:hypothetical protein